MILLALLAPGCTSTSSIELYENPDRGISLEKPKDWKLDYTERNGKIWLGKEEGFWHKDSVDVIIRASACVRPPGYMPEGKELLESEIDRVRRLYNLESVTTIQEITEIENGDRMTTTATIALPAQSLPEGFPSTEDGAAAPGAVQIVDIFYITEAGENLAIVFVYRGGSEKLNAEAQEIVDSIQFIRKCLPRD